MKNIFKKVKDKFENLDWEIDEKKLSIMMVSSLAVLAMGVAHTCGTPKKNQKVLFEEFNKAVSEEKIQFNENGGKIDVKKDHYILKVPVPKN